MQTAVLTNHPGYDSAVEGGEKVNRTLSPREVQVLELLADGCYYREISNRLEISYATVHTHIRRIYKKYEVHSRGRAVAKFLGDRAG
jgi:ATP/maltotriose-dependent transcriptional regulator MalT